LPLPIQKSAAKTATLPIQKSTSKNFATVDSDIGSKIAMLPIQKSTAKTATLAIQKSVAMVESFRLYFFFMFIMLVAKRAMEEAQCLMQTNPSDLEIHRAEPILVKEYVRLVEVEGSFHRQKSRL
jgi:hypothetical protein